MVNTMGKQFTDQQLADLLCSAFEGGSNYWYQLENDTDDTSKPYWERVFTDGLTVSNARLFQRHDDEPTMPNERIKTATVNRASMLKALDLMHSRYPKHYADFISGNEDATTADVFLQLIVMGDVVYG